MIWDDTDRDRTKVLQIKKGRTLSIPNRFPSSHSLPLFFLQPAARRKALASHSHGSITRAYSPASNTSMSNHFPPPLGCPEGLLHGDFLFVSTTIGKDELTYFYSPEVALYVEASFIVPGCPIMIMDQFTWPQKLKDFALIPDTLEFGFDNVLLIIFYMSFFISTH